MLSPISDSVAKDIGPASTAESESTTDESSRARSRSDLESLESHGGTYLRTYTIARAITLNTVSRFYYFRVPLLFIATSRTLHSTTRFGFLCDLLLYNVHPRGLLINYIDQKSYFI